MRRVNLFVVICLLVVLGVGIWRLPSLRKSFGSSKENEFQTAREYVESSEPKKAFPLISRHFSEIQKMTPAGKKWGDLLIKATEESYGAPGLAYLYKQTPQLIESQESASLLAAEGLLLEKNYTDFTSLRDTWKNKGENQEPWILLDVQHQLAMQEPKEALTLLQSTSFQGNLETKRLLLLAFTTAHENPRLAWDYLDKALEKDPKNPLIYSYRGKLLEAVGRPNLALQEYLEAATLAPKTPFIKDQLAEFYLRNGQIPFALEIWESLAKEPNSFFIWTKAWFWNRVAVPLPTLTSPQLKSQPLIHYFLSLKPNQFWDQAAFQKIPNSTSYLKSMQQTFWLKLLSALKNGHDEQALELLKFNTFKQVSWNLELEIALQRILNYKKTDSLVLETDLPDAEFNQATLKDPSSKSFFEELAILAKMEKEGEPLDKTLPIITLLKSQDAIPAAFLAAGWDEAALNLQGQRPLESGLPIWVPIAFVEAIRENRSTEEALTQALNLPSNPELDLLIGELQIEQGEVEKGLSRILPYVKEETPLGFKAAELVSLIFIEQEDYKQAASVIENQKQLQASLIGKETLARIASLEGNKEKADALYQSIAQESFEAKSYLARQAFEAKDLNTAEKLTKELLQEYPNNSLLLENFQRIQELKNQP